jgi:hypothetical protein
MMDILHEDDWDDDGDDAAPVREKKKTKWGKRPKPCDMKNPEWQAKEELFKKAQRLGLPQAEQLFVELYGRIGMHDSDAFAFVPHPVKHWTLREIKNRLKWLHGQKALVLGKGDKKAIEKLEEKIRRYTKELFKRYSAENLAEQRKEFNRKRRAKRAREKRSYLAAMTRAWFAKRKAARKALKQVATTEP